LIPAGLELRSHRLPELPLSAVRAVEHELGRPPRTRGAVNDEGDSLEAHAPGVYEGKYTFIVRDKADIHNFTLKGPGVRNKMITGTGFVGTKTVTLRLRTGKYRFYCTVHPTITGTLKVT
jgi:hypothetical protein